MLEKTLTTRAEKLAHLLEINQELSATLDLQELLQSIVDAAAELTESEQASIAEYSSSENTLRFIAARWMDPDVMAEMRVPLEGSISGKAFRELKPVIAQDAQKDELYRQVDETSGFQTRSLLAVPMMMHGQATGVLSALNKEDSAGFNDQDVEVLTTLASQAAIAIHNSQLLQESEEAYAHLAELDEMKNNFIAIASHELRVPLSLILGHASFLKEVSADESLKQVEVIERNALRLRDVVDDLSQIEDLQTDQASLRPLQVDAVELLDDIAKRYKTRAEEEKIELRLQIQEEPLAFEGEREKIRTAVDHLLKNAFAYTDASGHVDLILLDEGDWLSIQVADTGAGISEKDLSRIFERFYQAEDHMTRKHGGLGLTVAKTMVEMHGGEILVESVLDKGSQFTIRLPKQQA